MSLETLDPFVSLDSAKIEHGNLPRRFFRKPAGPRSLETFEPREGATVLAADLEGAQNKQQLTVG